MQQSPKGRRAATQKQQPCTNHILQIFALPDMLTCSCSKIETLIDSLSTISATLELQVAEWSSYCIYKFLDSL